MANAYPKVRLGMWAAVLTMTACFVGVANSAPEDPVAWITQYEHDAAAADLSGDVSFYQKTLADDWTDGMSNGQFQDKKKLISDLSDKANNITFHETISDLKVRCMVRRPLPPIRKCMTP